MFITGTRANASATSRIASRYWCVTVSVDTMTAGWFAMILFVLGAPCSSLCEDWHALVIVVDG